jgi:Cyclic nucleotide-binding domain
MDPLELLRANPFLSQLTEAELGRLRKRAVTRRWKKGEVIFRKGDTYNDAIVILSGSALTVMHSASGVCHPTGIRARGDILGIIPVLDGGGRISAAVAREATCALCLDRREFNDIVADRPELRSHIIAVLCRGVRSLSHRTRGWSFSMSLLVWRAFFCSFINGTQWPTATQSSHRSIFHKRNCSAFRGSGWAANWSSCAMRASSGFVGGVLLFVTRWL